MEHILDYIKETYEPSGIIVYGSFANGTNVATSDFDALVITDHASIKRDNHTVVNGVLLDLFFYSPATLEDGIDPMNFVQVYDGAVVLDRDGAAERLKARVVSYINSLPPKTREQNEVQMSWCEKMLSRAARGDGEGLYRHHWLLVDSLEIYCDFVGWHYFGPKKMLARLSAEDAEAARLYTAALSLMSVEALAAWVAFLKETWMKGGRS